MKCPNCSNPIAIQLGVKMNYKNCQIHPEILSVVLVKCNNCKKTFRVPIKSKSFLDAKKQ
ncbi:MAG: hypothetical protein NT076_03530 [Candidatus Pacearchaeota archaeon]|nr:hypothetical protein [Candidatus Pacearchaeota archaeon]